MFTFLNNYQCEKHTLTFQFFDIIDRQWPPEVCLFQLLKHFHGISSQKALHRTRVYLSGQGWLHPGNSQQTGEQQVWIANRSQEIWDQILTGKHLPSLFQCQFELIIWSLIKTKYISPHCCIVFFSLDNMKTQMLQLCLEILWNRGRFDKEQILN